MAVEVYSDGIVFDFIVGNIKVRVSNVSKEFPDPNWFVNEHYHNDYEIHIIESGQGHINLDGRDFMVKQNDLYITAPNVMHRQRSDRVDPMTELSIEFSVELLDNEGYDHYFSESRHLIDVLSRKYVRPFRFDGDIRKDFYAIVDNIEKKPLGYYLYTQVLIVKLIIDIIRTVATNTKQPVSYKVPEKTVDEKRIDKVLRYIEIHLNNTFTVVDAAKMVRISPKQLNRIMLKHTGMTFNGYSSFFRYKSALSMLLNTNLDISDIALTTGFYDTQQMYRKFLKYAGVSPSKIRKMAKSNPDSINYLQDFYLCQPTARS
jgi:AraC-like DNA-binding protein